MTAHNKVWLVTGASSGLGLATVKELLAAGYRVAATTRDVEKLRAAVGGDYGAAQFLPLTMQVTDEADVQRGIAAITAHFGRLDVVMNNAGYILIGAIEELSDAEIRANFDVNVFATMHIIRAVMPVFRAQNSGYFLTIASISGSTTAPGAGDLQRDQGSAHPAHRSGGRGRTRFQRVRDGGLPRRPAHRFSRRFGALPAGAARRLPQRART